MPDWELFDHTADIGLRVYGATLPELFEHAGAALFDLLTDVKRVEPRETRRLRLARDSAEELLVEWLSELLFLHDAQGFVCCRCAIDTFTGTELSATVTGEPLCPGRHEMKTELKAITYHGLAIAREGGGFRATVILDA